MELVSLQQSLTSGQQDKSSLEMELGTLVSTPGGRGDAGSRRGETGLRIRRFLCGCCDLGFKTPGGTVSVLQCAQRYESVFCLGRNKSWERAQTIKLNQHKLCKVNRFTKFSSAEQH